MGILRYQAARASLGVVLLRPYAYRPGRRIGAPVCAASAVDRGTRSGAGSDQEAFKRKFREG